MKKILGILSLVLLFSCSERADGFQGNEYVYTAENGTEVTLRFAQDENRVNGRVVNGFFGSFELDGNNIKFSPMGATMMMGPMDKMEVERNFFNFIATVDKINTKGDKLILSNSKSGQTMEFVKKAE